MKIKMARFQTNLFVGNLGDLGDTLPCKHKTFPDLEMELVDVGLKVSIKSQVFVIPHANIKLMEAFTEEKAKK